VQVAKATPAKTCFNLIIGIPVNYVSTIAFVS